MKSVISFFIILLFLVSNAQQLEEKLENIDSIIASKVTEKAPGIAVGIIKDGNIIYEKYLGLANLQHQVPFNEKTRSNIASTAKQFTALMILQLSLEEKLSLEDDIRKYLPNLYSNVKDIIRIRHLINHTSGVRDYVELLDLEGDVWWKRFGLGNDNILELLENQQDLGFAPGSTYSYSNSNYNLLAKIIEKVTAQSFNDYSKQFFNALGMNETSFVEKYMAVIPNRANPYSDWGNGEWWEVPTVTKTNGEGFLYTTLQDQLKYEQLLQNAITENNTLLIKSQQSIPNSEITTYGFGLELENILGRNAVHHPGGTFGFHSQTIRFPEENLTVFIMSNNGNISSNLIAQEVSKILLPSSNEKNKYDEQFYKETDKNNLPILGKYTYPNENKMVEILEKNNRIYWKERAFTLEMVPDKENIYSFTNDPDLKIKFYKEKLVEYYSSGKTMTYMKSNEKLASSKDLNGLVGNYYNKELDIDFSMELIEDNKLQFKLSSNKGFSDVLVYNKKFLLADSYFLEVKKDQFNRVKEILLTHDRAYKIRFKKRTNLKFQPKISTENGSIQVTTIGSQNGETSDILLTKNQPNGNEIWSKRFGGNGYDKANSILDTTDGFLIIGSTSSYGKGNYDIYVIKTDKKGNKIWQNTFGGLDNDYGYTAEKVSYGYIIKGTIQRCNSRDVLNRKCTNNVWFVTINNMGREISNEILEEIVN
ncbi:MAG: serine hydrolase domain-containing protein [Jejuia sp.]